LVWFAEFALGRGHFRRNAARAIGLLMLASCVGYGQTQTPQYIEYPLQAGKTHEYHRSSLPSWVEFDSRRFDTGRRLLHLKVFYALPHLFWSPRCGGEYDWASGNAAPPSRTVGTFDQQYPSNHNAFGPEDIFGYENIREARVSLDLAEPDLRLSFADLPLSH
jgi:hypothetical protein